jgi:hypothetical protein
MFRWTPANILWLTAYFVTMAAIVLGMRNYRAVAIETYGTNEAGENWQDWRTAAKELGKGGPVQRSAPKSNEPPPLVLMRDHFAACLGISLLLSSCLFGWLMICVRGVLRPVALYEDDD